MRVSRLQRILSPAIVARNGVGRTRLCALPWNWEIDKNAYRKGPITVTAGPFLDTGKITDPTPGLGSHKWLWDIGLQTKVRAFGMGVVFSYGKDLRSGNNALCLHATLHDYRQERLRL